MIFLFFLYYFSPPLSLLTISLTQGNLMYIDPDAKDIAEKARLPIHLINRCFNKQTNVIEIFHRLSLEPSVADCLPIINTTHSDAILKVHSKEVVRNKRRR